MQPPDPAPSPAPSPGPRPARAAAPWHRRLAARLAADGIVLLARLVTAVRAVWAGVEPVPEQRVYFANHASNGDFVLLWAALPPRLRRRTRPVAAADYWLRSALRRFVIREVFDAVLIERRREHRSEDPIALMTSALDAGRSLIIFPEGTRNPGDGILPFRSGLYNLALRRPEIPLVPVWIDNLNRVLPKGEILPVPFLCTVTFGAAIRREPDEAHDAFLARASAALLATRPERPGA